MALMFVVIVSPLSAGGVRKDLSIMVKPFSIVGGNTLPYSKTDVYKGSMISSNTIILGTRCCPPSSNFNPFSFSECVNKLLNAQQIL